MEFNIRQQNVINSKDKNILCLAASASGKTATLVARINRLLSEGENPESIVCFTFTNQAAIEMQDRLSNSYGIYIGTVHSYANKICQSAGIYTGEDIASENFDNIIRKALILDKKFYPYVKYLFIDEFQDTDDLQAKFIAKINAEYNYATGDERQFIYGFKGTSDKYIRNLAENPFVKKYYLTQNYRNGFEILRFAENFLNGIQRISPSSEPMSKEKGYIDEDHTFYEAVEELTWTEDWTEWAILCRTNKEVQAAQDYLDEMEIPNITIKKSELSFEEIKEVLHSNKVKIMTGHASKGLEFDNVIAVGAKQFNNDEKRLSYVMATRARKTLLWCPSIKRKKVKKNKKSNIERKNQMIEF